MKTEVNKPTKSKINYTALLISLVTLGLLLGGASPEVKSEVLTITTLVGPALIMTLRTWFTDVKA